MACFWCTEKCTLWWVHSLCPEMNIFNNIIMHNLVKDSLTNQLRKKQINLSLWCYLRYLSKSSGKIQFSVSIHSFSLAYSSSSLSRILVIERRKFTNRSPKNSSKKVKNRDGNYWSAGRPGAFKFQKICARDAGCRARKRSTHDRVDALAGYFLILRALWIILRIPKFCHRYKFRDMRTYVSNM